ncbi:MAG: YlbF family regulator [Lachnospiraceae bacterium]|nr:YlbF family regulator [Lachnospiraceae bacterium]
MMTKEAYQLNQVIKDSEEYQNYQKTKNRVKENQELYQAMNAFRRRNFELQSYIDNVNRYEEILNLSLEYEKVLRNPLVNEFLKAEQIFSRKLTEVYEVIAEGLELDYDYME